MSRTHLELEHDERFSGSPRPYLLLDRSLRIAAANQAYLEATGRTKDELNGRQVFDAFPDNPADPDANGVANLGASLEKVLRTGRLDRMWVQRYDVPGTTPGDPFVLKYWSPVNHPVREHRSGPVVGIVHHVEDVTSLWAPLHGVPPTPQANDIPSADDWAKFVAAVSTNERVHEETAREVAQLRQALSSRVVVEQAKGIIMARRRCSPNEAFEILRKAARDSNVKLHALAASLVESVADNG